MNPIISVTDLCKRFKIFKSKPGFLGSISSLFLRECDYKDALAHVSFSINEGESLGYIGPNGAGKSTTIKILSGIIVPDSGDVKVFGKVPWKSRIEVVRNIGVVFGQRTQLWWDLPVRDSFSLLKDIYKIPSNEYKNNLERFSKELELSKIFDVPVRQLSLGQRMRCDIVASLLHSPKILFLDEPTIGLDAISKLSVRKFIRSLNEEHRVTVMLTTHDMDDIEAICNRVLILNEGSIFFDGTLEDVRQKIYPEKLLIVDLLGEDKRIDVDNVELIKKENNRFWIKFNPNVISAKQLITSIVNEHDVHDIYVENPPIEEIVAKFYL